MSRRRVLALDLSGVLVTFNPAARLRALADLARLPEQEVQARVWGAGLSPGWDRGTRETAAEVRADLREALHLDVPDSELDDAWALAFPPDPDAAALLPAEPDPDLLLFTNNGPLEEDVLLRRHPSLLRPFGDRCFTYRLGACKPEPEAYRALERRTGAAPDEITFLDDSLSNVEGARAAGWTATTYRSTGDLARVLADHAGNPRR